jgi:hypothetical protein
MIKWLSQRVKSTSTTEVFSYFPAQPNKQAVVRRMQNLPTHASDTLNFYVPKADFATIVTRDTTPTQSTTHLYVDVDVAGGHVIKGHTLVATDFLIACTGTGPTLINITTVTDVASATYCDLTVPTLGAACIAGDKVYVVRAADVTAYASGGTSLVTYQDWIAGNIGLPLVVGSLSAGSNDQISTITVEYV